MSTESSSSRRESDLDSIIDNLSLEEEDNNFMADNSFLQVLDEYSSNSTSPMSELKRNESERVLECRRLPKMIKIADYLKQL